MLRRPLLWIFLLAAGLHTLGTLRADLPAQDGLKFIRVARQFQERPWPEVVRGTDQHPLYPALVALAEPVSRLVWGRGPAAWRVAAQGVSALASLALLWPLYGLTRVVFDHRTAVLATLLWVLLPQPGALGHDTLSDPLALCWFTTAWYLGARSLRPGGGWRLALASGLSAGLGYLTRPEALVTPLVLGLVGVSRGLPPLPSVRAARPRHAALVSVFLVTVGGYALVKGEVSEKLALRRAAALPPSAAAKVSENRLPTGLDDPRWDFAPKEETGHAHSLRLPEATRRVLGGWAENLAGVLAVLALWGAWRGRVNPEARPAVTAALVYLVLFAIILVRHVSLNGYLSGRHTMTLALLSVPWAAAGLLAIRAGLLARIGERPQARWWRWGILAGCVVLAVAVQAKQGHPSRWGHQQAGRWLAQHASPGEAVLDTRGWAAFVSGLPSYDPWHFGPALRDPRLSYVVVGTDELHAPSRRAASLRAVLAAAATPVAGFPERRGGRGTDIQVFRFEHPPTWEGLSP